MKKWMTYTMAFMAMAAWSVQNIQAQDKATTTQTPGFVDENGDGINDYAGFRHGHRGIGKIVSLLSDAQKTELQTLLESLKAAEASKKDVRAAVDAKLAEWGIEKPEIAGPRGLEAVLTAEQRTELSALIKGLKEADASREDVHAAVDAKLAEWGIEKPEPPVKAGRGGRMGHRGRGAAPAATGSSK